MKNQFILLFLSLAYINICVGQLVQCAGNPFGASVSYSCATVSYGQYSKQKYDIYVPSGSDPKPVVIFIHGGGFVSGDKKNIKKPSTKVDARFFLEQGCIVASINYRLLKTSNETVGIRKCIQDAKDAVAHIRSLRNNYGSYTSTQGISDLQYMDPDRIALWGSSAGAGIAMLIGFDDDAIGNPIKAIWADKPQATYDINKWHGQNGVFPDCNLLNIINILTMKRIKAIYGKANMQSFSLNYLLTDPAMIAYRQEVDMLNYIEETDPPIWIENTSQDNNVEFNSCTNNTHDELLNHHKNHCTVLKDKLDGIPVERHLRLREIPSTNIITTHSTWATQFKSAVAFVKNKLQ